MFHRLTHHKQKKSYQLTLFNLGIKNWLLQLPKHLLQTASFFLNYTFMYKWAQSRKSLHPKDFLFARPMMLTNSAHSWPETAYFHNNHARTLFQWLIDEVNRPVMSVSLVLPYCPLNKLVKSTSVSVLFLWREFESVDGVSECFSRKKKVCLLGIECPLVAALV